LQFYGQTKIKIQLQRILINYYVKLAAINNWTSTRNIMCDTFNGYIIKLSIFFHIVYNKLVDTTTY